MKFLFVCISVISLLVGIASSQADPTAAFAASYSLEAAGNYKSAIAKMKEVYDKSSYEQNMRLGWLHYLAGLHAESQTYYQNAINLMPYSIEAKLGFVLPAAQLNAWELVKKQYEEILKIDPKHTIANYRLGLIHYNNKQFPTALKYFETVANLFPMDYDNLLMYAWANYQTGKLREAKVLFHKVLWLSPGDKSATEGLSLIK
ncbi:MAG: tetratricopeptide repeat protein [Bacteroidia bacterium]|nr:tetratricopeptide repeat protein [Bacteroidia bacterium]